MKYLKLFESEYISINQFEMINYREMINFINSHIMIQLSEEDGIMVQEKFDNMWPNKYKLKFGQLQLGYMPGEERNMREGNPKITFVDLFRTSVCFHAFKDSWYILEIQSDKIDYKYFKCDELQGLLNAIDYCRKMRYFS